jgi:hypothetical protein
MGKSILFVSLVVAISLVFTVSCVTKDVPVTETYYETEYRTESYIEVVGCQADYLTPKRTWNSAMSFNAFEWGQQMLGTYYLGYEITTGKHSPSVVALKLGSATSPWVIQVIDLTGVGQLSPPPPRDPLKEKVVYENGVKKITAVPEFQEWLDNLNTISTDPERCLCFTMYDQYTGREIVVDVTGVDEFAIILNTSSTWGAIIEKVQLIWFNEITKERQVPYQVEKQRTVMQTEKVPFWEVFFGK